MRACVVAIADLATSHAVVDAATKDMPELGTVDCGSAGIFSLLRQGPLSFEVESVLCVGVATRFFLFVDA